MAKRITIDRIETSQCFTEQLPLHSIDVVNWSEFDYRPKVSFRVAYTHQALCIKFYVDEKHVKGSYLNDNETVCKDSCVEFFVRVPNSDVYFNFEFNCLGTLLAAKRVTRPTAQRLSVEELGRVVRIASLGRLPLDISENPPAWDLYVEIPFELLGCSEPPSSLLANFYKCGDATAEPHYLSWSPIDSAKPNFHTPEMFGELMLY